MTREQAKEILDGMSLEDCIKMWNDNAADMYQRSTEIHENEDDGWWTWLSNELGAYYLVGDIAKSIKERKYCHYDQYFFYDENECYFYSFDDKKEMMKITEGWFIEELINREN
jgi:hypothetical protein